MEQIGAELGDSFALDVDRDNPDVIRLRRIRRSYAGALDGVWGGHDQVLEYLRNERASWAE